MAVATYPLPFITWQVVDRLLALLRECHNRGLAEPVVLPDNHGGVRLRWVCTDGASVEVELLNAGRIVLAGAASEGRFDPVGIVNSVTGSTGRPVSMG